MITIEFLTDRLSTMSVHGKYIAVIRNFGDATVMPNWGWRPGGRKYENAPWRNCSSRDECIEQATVFITIEILAGTL